LGFLVCSTLVLVVAPAYGFGCGSSGGGCDGVIAFSSAHEENPEIYFNSFRDDTVGLYVMNPDGSGERHLTPFSDYVMQGSWCPHAQRR